MLAGGRLLIIRGDEELDVEPAAGEDSGVTTGVDPVLVEVDEGLSIPGGEAEVTSPVPSTLTSGMTVVALGPEREVPRGSERVPGVPIPERATVMVPASGSSVGMSKLS